MTAWALPQPLDGRIRFGVALAGFLILAALVAGLLPLGLSLVGVFLFAGPHNWVEARYFLSRLPARWGRLQPFFLVSIAGVGGLTAGFAVLPWLVRWASWDGDGWLCALATWNTLLVVWLAVLMQLRSRHNPRRDWPWTWPAGLMLIAVAWWTPVAWDLALVYLHPLVGLWILDREIRRSRPEYRRLFHCALAILPLCLAGLWWQLAHTPDLPGTDALTSRIVQHAGADLLRRVSSHFLVASHAFLELIHYGAWLVAIPWCLGTKIWQLDGMPLARRSSIWKGGIHLFMLAGLVIVILLWACFLADYPTTRDVYFTLAMAHVLAEVPFLLRSL